MQIDANLNDWQIHNRSELSAMNSGQHGHYDQVDKFFCATGPVGLASLSVCINEISVHMTTANWDHSRPAILEMLW